jgi:hypothetical protein
MTLLTLPSLAWTPSPNYSSRRSQRVRLIVVHDCEGSFAGSVSWFAMAKSQVSAHVVLREDGLSAVQMVAWSAKAWHACDVNSFSEGVEAAGFATKGLGAAEWKGLAAIVAFRLRANGVPCQVATAANDWTGFCQHADLGAMGGGHHDITHDGAVWANFVELVRACSGADMPASWTPAGLAPAPSRPAGWTPHNAIRHDLPVGSIEWTQAALNAIGAPASLLDVDGVEGAATRAAIESFQAHAGIGVDGDAGPQTVAALEKALALSSAARPGA